MIHRLLFCMATLFSSGTALAQSSRLAGFWLDAAYTYTDVDFKQTDMSEKGQFPGVKGELGIGLFGNLGVSAAGEYMDGHMQYEGQTLDDEDLSVTTNDYIRDLRALAHLGMGAITLSGGVGQRYWYNNTISSYRRRTQYEYYPLMLTYGGGPMYLRFEYDLWKSGKNKTHMSDVSDSRNDVEFNLGGGTGYGAELGFVLPSPTGIRTRFFVHYHKWDVKASDTQSDGVDNLVEMKSETSILQLGIGLEI